MRYIEAAIEDAKKTGVLNLNDNELTSLPATIGNLTKLTWLDLSDHQLTSLPTTIGKLTNLTTLSVYGNQLTSLPTTIGKLTNLTWLDLSDHQLTSLPATIGNLTNLTRLDLNGNQLPIPPEILRKRSSPKEILDYYLQIITTETRPLNEAKLLVVGEASVGKTSLAKRLLGHEFDARENMTDGIERNEWQIGSEDDAVRLNVWDFGGQEIMHATHQFFLTKRSLYLLVIDSRQNERQSRIGYWLRMIESFGDDAPVIIVCNKCDQRRVELDWQTLLDKHANLRDIAMAVSCADPPLGITELRAQIEREVGLLSHVRDPFPDNWFVIKKHLEQMPNNYLAYDEYRQLCKSHGVRKEDDQRRLIGFLHDLGTVLHFHDHPILQSENILNPEWVTKGVYCIITRDELDGKGVLQFDQLGELLPADEYPTALQHQFIVEMMRRFELCFDFEDQTNQKYLIPGLLPKRKPALGNWPDSLKFQYQYEVLPDSVISRFIVRMHTFIDGETYWRTGVVLVAQDGENRALIEADLEDGVISISIIGDDKGRRRFLDVIRASFFCIHATLQRIGVREFVPLRDHPNEVIPYDRLVQFERHGKDEDFAEIGGTLISIPIKEYLDGVSHLA
jgi:internalin A